MLSKKKVCHLFIFLFLALVGSAIFLFDSKIAQAVTCGDGTVCDDKCQYCDYVGWGAYGAIYECGNDPDGSSCDYGPFACYWSGSNTSGTCSPSSSCSGGSCLHWCQGSNQSCTNGYVSGDCAGLSNCTEAYGECKDCGNDGKTCRFVSEASTTPTSTPTPTVIEGACGDPDQPIVGVSNIEGASAKIGWGDVGWGDESGDDCSTSPDNPGSCGGRNWYVQILEGGSSVKTSGCLSSDTRSWDATGLDTNTEYEYKVWSINSCDCDRSQEGSFTTTACVGCSCELLNDSKSSFECGSSFGGWRMNGTATQAIARSTEEYYEDECPLTEDLYSLKVDYTGISTYYTAYTRSDILPANQQVHFTGWYKVVEKVGNPILRASVQHSTDGTYAVGLSEDFESFNVDSTDWQEFDFVSPYFPHSSGNNYITLAFASSGDTADDHLVYYVDDLCASFEDLTLPEEPPEFISFSIKNSDDVVVLADGLDRNHICQSEFMAPANPRQVNFEITIEDEGGYDQIDDIRLRFYISDSYFAAIGTDLATTPVYSMAGAGAGMADFVGTPSVTNDTVNNRKTVVFPILFDSSFDSSDFRLHNVEIYASDTTSQVLDWTDTTRDFKVWDCQVDVSGSLYDASVEGIRLCSTSVGYTNLVESGILFSLEYVAGVGNETMTVTSPTYDDGGNTLTWGEAYWANFGGGVLGSDPSGYARVTALVDGVSTTTCPGATVTLGLAVVGPYDDNPSMVVDFSTITNQDPWFQTSNMSIQSKSSLSRSTPITCVSDITGSCIPAVTKDDDGYDGNGVVLSSSLTSSSGCSEADGCEWGSDDDLYKGYNPNFITVDYDAMYRDLYVSKGVGRTATSWAEVMGGTGTGLVFYDGDLTIDAGNSVAVGDFLMVVVTGDITVDPSVTIVDGAFVTDGNFSASGDIDGQLVISGMIYAGDDIILTRGFSTPGANNTVPAVSVVYRPDIIFNAPSYMFTTISGL